MSEVILGVAMFTGVILLVVMLLLAARSKLVSAGDVTIEINGDRGKALRVQAGGTLLGRLANQKIFVP